MSLALANYHVLNENDVTTPTSTISSKYRLGQIYYVMDSDAPSLITAYMYVKAHAALTQYQPYVVHGTNTSGAEFVTAAPATIAGQETVCVPQVAFTSGYFGFVAVQGRATVLLINETHVAGDYLELLNAGAALVVDGTSGATVYGVKGVAIQVGTLVGAGSTTVNLLGGYRTSLVSAA